MLRLTLKKMWFDLMICGEKKIEYRKPSKWILSRLENKDYKYIEFKNGYRKDSPRFVCEYLGYFYAEKNEIIYFSNGVKLDVEQGDIMIHLGKIIETDEQRIKQEI